MKFYAFQLNDDKSLHDGDSNSIPTNQKCFNMQIANRNGHFELVQSAGHWYILYVFD